MVNEAINGEVIINTKMYSLYNYLLSNVLSNLRHERITTLLPGGIPYPPTYPNAGDAVRVRWVDGRFAQSPYGTILAPYGELCQLSIAPAYPGIFRGANKEWE